MFDGSIPVSKAGGPGQDVKFHISLVIVIHKGEGEVLEFLCSAWPDSIEITNLFVRGNDKKPSRLYFSPQFKELDDELCMSSWRKEAYIKKLPREAGPVSTRAM
ncbi:hypothetical protein Q3G72_004095 [Acer saccharum]|nr:hypothetical protein Q3G72_004095 [Acer saccharum]